MTALAVLGAVALVPLFVAFAAGLILWRTWWLYPMWQMVVVPLGAPSITFWHFLALLTFWQAGFVSHHINTDKSETDYHEAGYTVRAVHCMADADVLHDSLVHVVIPRWHSLLIACVCLVAGVYILSFIR